MKKLFLTSALILGLASSAFAAMNPDFNKIDPQGNLGTVINGNEFKSPVASYQGDTLKLANRIHDKYENGFKYVPSQKQYGSGNYWPTRQETLASHTADCKGFAVASYYDALEAGFDENRLFIWVVVLKKTGEIHAVTVMDDYVIDRLVNRVITLDEANTIYTNIYHFNRKGWETTSPKE